MLTQVRCLNAFFVVLFIGRFYVSRWNNGLWDWLGNQRRWNVLDCNQKRVYTRLLGWVRIRARIQVRLVY